MTRDRQAGYTHGWVLTFTSAADRDYYVHHDPHHLAFIASLQGIYSHAFILDHTPSKFQTLAELAEEGLD